MKVCVLASVCLDRHLITHVLRRYEDQGRVRPIIHRASTVEIIVPYGDPRSPFHKKCAFDVVVSLLLQLLLFASISQFPILPEGRRITVQAVNCTYSSYWSHEDVSLHLQDYGLGFSCSSLSLGCDCLGHIKYFPAVLNTNQGASQPCCTMVSPIALAFTGTLILHSLFKE